MSKGSGVGVGVPVEAEPVVEYSAGCSSERVWPPVGYGGVGSGWELENICVRDGWE